MRQLKLFFYTLTHWEYWNFRIIYFPIYFQYLWYVVKTRSFFYFNAVNPSMKNGGFFNQSKNDIYRLIPQKYYPKTILVTPKSNFTSVLQQLKKETISFPLIAKPDKGLRGILVKKITTKAELQHYLNQVKCNVLLQNIIPFTNEIGLFYVKFPKKQQGKITGIVFKEFLTVIGNGTDDIETLIKKNKRYNKQLTTLQKEYKGYLKTVLQPNEKKNLVPYGNHCRGTKFIDYSHKITPKLTTTFTTICATIPDFYYGRIDIMFSNFKDLENGKNFQIVEINGALSEPTHIYDPKHSLLFAWKELYKHFRYMYLISVENNKKGIDYLSFKQGMYQLKLHFKNNKLFKNF